MSADEEGEIKPEREKTDGGRVLINEGRQEEGAPKAIKRVALVPPAQTIDRNSIMDGIIETMQHFVKDELGAAYAQFITHPGHPAALNGQQDDHQWRGRHHPPRG